MKRAIKLLLLSAIILIVASCTGLSEPDYAKARLESYDDFKNYYDQKINKVDPEKLYTLNECLVLAVNNNLDLYSRKLEEAVSDEKAMSHLLSALPTLKPSFNYSERDKENGATSEGIEDGLESLRASKSSEKSLGTFRLELALSSLDFGLALINRHFENDKKRKVTVNRTKAERELKFQVVQAYYAVAAGQYVLLDAKNQLTESNEALTKLEKLYDEKEISKFELLKFKKKLLETNKQIKEYERSHQNHCLSLTALLGLYPDNEILVDLTSFKSNSITGRFNTKRDLPEYEELEKTALFLREELLELDIDNNISVLKEKAEYLKLFPNVRLFAAYNESSNPFLYNKSWSEAGLNAIVDLFQIPSRLKNISAEEKEREVIRYKQLATMINITAQLKIAFANCEEVKERLCFKELIHEVTIEQKQLIQVALNHGAKNQLDLLESEIDLLISQIQRTAAFANYNVALHRMLFISASPSMDLTVQTKE